MGQGMLVQNDILAKLLLFSVSYKAPINLQVSIRFPLTPVSLQLYSYDGSKTKPKLFSAAVYNLVILYHGKLPSVKEMNT